MSRLRRTLRRLRRLLAYGLASLVIVAGLGVALTSQVLPLLGRNPQWVADWLSRQAGRPVALSGVSAAWTRQGPQLGLEGLRIGSGEQRLDVGRAELQLDVYAGLFPGRPLSTLQLSGLVLALEPDAAGRWQLQGLAGASGSGSVDDALEQLDALGELYLHHARLRIADPARGIDLNLPQIDARLRRSDGRLTLGIVALDPSRAPLAAVLEFDPDSRQGRGWLHADALPLAGWRDALAVPAAPLLDGRLSGQAWFDFDIGGVQDAQFELAIDALRLAAGGSADTEPAVAGSWPAQRIDGHWARLADGWRLTLESPQPAGSAYLAVQLDGDAHWRAELADWPLAPAARLAAHHPALPEALRDWLQAAAPDGHLTGLQAEFDRDGLQSLHGRVDRFGFAAVGTQPGVSGLSAGWHGDAAGFDIKVAGDPLVIDWPPALLQPLRPAAAGTVRLFRDEQADWALEIGELRLREPDYDLTVAGGLRFDGGRPSASLRALVGEGPITAAKRFWIRHRMPKGTVAWLDEAIEGGRIERGHAFIEGDLDDWPFEGKQGRFEAEAIIRDVRLQFRPDWPVAEQVRGSARFIDDGMLIEASGRLRGLDAPRAVARIDEFDAPVLALDIEAHGSGEAMLDVLRHSQLQASHGEHFDALTIAGHGDAHVALAVPLKPGSPPAELNGTVTLHEAELADSRWDIAFSDADGAIRFSDRGVLVNAMEVRFDGQPAHFDLAIGSFTADPAQVAEARLQGRFEPASLLAARPSIGWLRPYLSGASEWRLELAVPQPDRHTPPTLRVRTDLVGTRLALPAPLAKSAAVQLPLQLEFDLQTAATETAAADGAAATEPGRLNLQLGELLRLYGRLDDHGFDGIAAFGAVPAVERPSQGLRVVGQVPVLDLGGWAGLAMSSSDGGDGLFADLDLTAGQIDLLDRSFAETRLRFSRLPDGGASLSIDGDAVKGEIELPPDPQRATRGITGRFDRLHWPEARDEAPRIAIGSPSLLPPLHVWIGDLRVADARLGEARLEAFPVEHGFRIERFETRSPALELFARGDWTRRGVGERSDFAIEFTAPDLGRMLSALGFTALVERGQTLVRLQASWPGAPTAFALELVDGWLEASVGSGRIPEVEPGGVGRVFGLLSLSEIPRRLALDFSDFFGSGLAFNRIEGRFVLDDGHAMTDDLLIDSPAAEIHIRGRTGLKTQDYEQTMEVLPRAGNLLPVVGALAGGPAGAAIGAVAQAVLSRQFKQMTRTLYKVDGGWDEPNIEVLERGPARPVAASEPDDGVPPPR